MKIEVLRKPLVNVLTRALRAIPAKNADNTFLCFLLETTQEGLSVTASNGVVSLRIKLPIKDRLENEQIKNIEVGGVCAPASMLTSFVSALSDDWVELRTDANYLYITDGKAKYELITKSGEEYPNIEFTPSDYADEVKLKSEDFHKAFVAVKDSVAIRGAKDLFYGINIKNSEGKLTFTATDTFRVARFTLDGSDINDFDFTAPVVALSLVDGLEGGIAIHYDDNSALFVAEDIVVSTRLLAGDFPEMGRIIPLQFAYSISINTDTILSAINSMLLIASANANNNPVRFEFSKDTCFVYASSPTYGNGKCPISFNLVSIADGNDDTFSITFNAEYVTTAIKALSSDKVTLLFNSNMSPFEIVGDDKHNLQLETPIRTSDML